MKKKLILFLATTLLITASSGCNSSPGSSGNNVLTDSTADPDAEHAQPAEGKIVLTFWNNFTGDDGELLRELVATFNDTNKKNIEIRMDIMPSTNLNEKLPLAISSNTAPDFFAAGDINYGSYTSNNVVKDLSSYWDYEGVDRSDFTETALSVTQVGGVQNFLPMQVQGFYLFWNKTLFEAAGLDPGKGPETWEELIEYAEKISALGNNTYGIGMPRDANDMFINWSLNYGGSILSDDQSESELVSDTNLMVLTKMREFAYEKKLAPESPTQADLENLMCAGQLGMILDGPWMNPGLAANEIDYGIRVIPKAAGSQNKAYLHAVGFAVPVTTDDSKMEYIYEFFKYWHSNDVCKTWSMENGFPPFLKSVVQDPEVQANEIVAEMSKQIDYAVPFLLGNPLISSISTDAVNPMLEAVLLGEDPQKALSEAEEVLNGIIK